MAAAEQPRGNVLMEWSFPEFIRHDRSRAWYLWFIVIPIILIAVAVWIQNYTFIGVIVLSTLILLIRLRRVPPQIPFSIREEGVEVDGRFYAWREFKDFWIIYRPPEVKKLYLHFRSTIRPALDISLEQQNPLKVRQELTQFLLENVEKEDEPLADQLTRYFKI